MKPSNETQKPKNKFNIGVKTYSWIKYLATISSIFLLISPIIGLIWFSGTNNGIGLLSLNNLNAIMFSLWAVGFFFLAFYIALRIHLLFVTKYKYQKGEKTKLWIAMGLYSTIPVLSLIVLIMVSVVHLNQPTNSASWLVPFIFGIILTVMVLITNILAAVFETLSRIGEQQFLYDQHDKMLQENETAVSDSGIKRTDEAQKFLAQQQTKTKSKKDQVKVEDKQILDDFFKKDDKD